MTSKTINMYEPGEEQPRHIIKETAYAKLNELERTQLHYVEMRDSFMKLLRN